LGYKDSLTLRIAKVCRTISHEALCILTGIPPITIKAEEAVALYNITTGRNIQKYQLDKEENTRDWLHPADTVTVKGTTVETTGPRRQETQHSYIHRRQQK
jgi:hypothetical protein